MFFRLSCFSLLAVVLQACGGNIIIDNRTDGGPPPTGPTLGDACDKAGALACNGTAQKLQLLCDGAHWIQNGVCSGALVCDPRPGPTQGSCQDPLAKCLSGAKTFCDGATRKTCNPDLLSTSDVKCGSASLCESSKTTGCAACAEKAHSCKGADLLVCTGGAWAVEKTCMGADVCDANDASCRPKICEATTWKCDGATLEQCNEAGTEWDTKSLCGGDCNAAEHRCDACPFEGKECIGDTPRTCGKLGSWELGLPCPSGCKGGECIDDTMVSCTPGEYRCTGDVLEACNGDGAGYTATATCSPGTCDAAAKSCSGGSGGGDCPTTGLRDCVGTTPRYCDDFHHYMSLAPCSGTTPVCFGGKCTEASVTSAMFPSKTSKTYDGASTSAPLDPTLRFFRKGSFVEELFPRTTTMTKLAVNFHIVDDTITTIPACKGQTVSFDAYVNLVKVGSFSFVTGMSKDVNIIQSFVFGPMSPASSTVLIHYEATTDLASSCGSWGWVPGGLAQLP